MQVNPNTALPVIPPPDTDWSNRIIQNGSSVEAPVEKPPSKIPSLSQILVSDLPREHSSRELWKMYKNSPRKSVGIFEKIGLTISNETVIARLFDALGGRDFIEEEDFRVTEEDIHKYARDLPEYQLNRVIADSKSFAEFIYETDQVRITNRKRAEVFSGGPLGMATGLGLTMLAAGGEAVALTLLATSSGGPLAGLAALGNSASRLKRVQGAVKAMGIAAAIDVPLETVRYNLDNSLRPLDIAVAIGASQGISGLVGAWKPHLFTNFSKTASIKETADAVEAAGDSALAASIREKARPALLSSREELAALSPKALNKKAGELGIPVSKVKGGKTIARNPEDIIEDMMGVSRKKRALNRAKDHVRTLSTDDFIRGKLSKSAAKTKKGKARLADEWLKIIKKTKFYKNLSPDDLKLLQKDPLGAIRKWRDDPISAPRNFRELEEAVAERLLKDPTAFIKGKMGETFFYDPTPIKSARKRFKAMSKSNVVLEAEHFKIPTTHTVKGKIVPRNKDDIVEDLIIHQKRALDAEDAAAESPIPPKPPGPTPPIPPKPPKPPPDDDLPDRADMIRIMEEELGGDVDRFTVFGHGKGLREAGARAIDIFPGDAPGLKHIFNLLAPVTIRMLRSKSPELRRFASTFLEHPRLGGQNITTVAKTNVERTLSRLWVDLEKAKVAARKAGTKLSQQELVRALRTGKEFSGPLGDALKALRKFNSEILKYGKEGGLLTEAIPESASYFHRAYRSTAFAKAIAEHGEDAIVEFFAQAVLRHPTSVKTGISFSDAKAISRRIVEYGRDPEGARSWKDTQIMVEKMRKTLIDEGIDEDDVDDYLTIIGGQINNQPHISYGKRRIDLDENYVGTLGGKDVHIDEFLDNNILKGTARYAQRVIGGVEVRKGMRAMFGKDGDTMSFGEFSSRIRKDMIAVGQKDVAKMERMIEHVYNSLTGLPIYKDPEAMKWIMGANSFSQATVGMVLGFAQLPEIASIMVRSGFQASFQQLPSLTEIANIFTMGIRDLATGREMLGMKNLKDDLAACLETFTGIGGDYRRGDHFMKRLDDMGFDDDFVSGSVTKYLDYGRQTAALNPLGIMPMDTFLRRWAVRSSFQHFVNEAYKVNKSGKVVLNKGYWNNAKVRFGELGIDGEAFERIAKVLTNPDYVEVRRGMFGGNTVKTFNVEKVADLGAFDEFALALRRHSDHMVQRQSFGESPYWVNTQVGKLLAQYRVFMLASKSKQMAAGIARGDMREAVNVVGSCGLGILAYQLQSHYRAAGMPEMERRKYLRERLGSQSTMIKAGIMKGSYSNIFPMIMDSMSWMIGKEPMFDPSMRATGLGIDPLTGSVPYSVLYGKTVPAAREITGALFRGDKLSKSDIRNIQSLVFPLKMPVIEQLINRNFTSELRIPKRD